MLAWYGLIHSFILNSWRLPHLSVISERSFTIFWLLKNPLISSSKNSICTFELLFFQHISLCLLSLSRKTICTRVCHRRHDHRIRFLFLCQPPGCLHLWVDRAPGLTPMIQKAESTGWSPACAVYSQLTWLFCTLVCIHANSIPL